MIDPIADPRTPAEAKRHWMIDRLWMMAVFGFVTLLFLVAIIWLGRWPNALAGQRLAWLGVLASGTLLVQAGVAVSFALGGPVGRWKGSWGNRSFEAEDDEYAARRAYDGGVQAP